MKCNSCGKRVEAEAFWVEFACPSCGKEKIIRCEKCKKQGNQYKCSKCGFTGP
ncbi:MAG: zinc finger domain-containing protein [Nanoarchaeota archaeon]